jgi:hypothetical protein
MNQDPVVCARLRTKGGWVPYGERVRWDSGFISNAVFWCVDTGDPVGPDDHFAHPHVCTCDRPCYRAEAVPRAEEYAVV